MKLLTPKDASEIMDVIDRVENLVKKGMPLHDAFAKVIKEAQLNRDKAHLAVRTWNISQFVSNRTIRDEIGWEEDLPVVDFEKVSKQVEQFPKQEKKAEVSPIYFRPPKEDPEPVKFIPHPEFKKYADVSPRLNYAFEVKAGKARLAHEMAQWTKLARHLRQEVNIKRSEIQKFIQEAVIPQLKNPEFDLNFACKHLIQTNKKAAAVLVSLVRAKKITDPDPYRIKKAGYDPKHPFYANLIKAADLIENAIQLEKLYENVAKVARNLIIRYRNQFGVPDRRLTTERFIPEGGDEYRLMKNGSYCRQPVLNMEVIAPGMEVMVSDTLKKKVKKADSTTPPQGSQSQSSGSSGQTSQGGGGQSGQGSSSQPAQGAASQSGQGQSNQPNQGPSNQPPSNTGQKPRRRGKGKHKSKQQEPDPLVEALESLRGTTRFLAERDRELFELARRPLYKALNEVYKEMSSEIGAKVREAEETLRPRFAKQRILGNTLYLVTTDPYLAGVPITDIYQTYEQLYPIAPDLFDNPHIAGAILKKYFAADRTLDLSEITALLRAQQRTKTSSVSLSRAVPTALLFGTIGGLTPAVFIQDRKKLPLAIIIGSLLGAGTGYFVSNALDAPITF